MPNVAPGQSGSVTLQPGYTLNVVAPVGGSGFIRRVGPNSQLTGNRLTPISAGQTKRFGPFRSPFTYSVEAVGLGLAYTIDKPQFDYANQVGNIEPVDVSFTAKETDCGKIFRNDTATNITITIANSLNEGWNIGVAQWSTGTITIAAASGAVKRGGGAATTAQYQTGSVVIVKNADDATAEYKVSGDLT